MQFLRSNAKVGRLAIQADDVTGISAATKHLLDLGHRRMGFIGGLPHLSTGVRRAAGYQAALGERGLEWDEQLIRLGPTHPDFGAEALEQLMAGAPAITGLVVASSRQLLGVLRTAHAKQVRIPTHLSVVGYGDADWLEVSDPPLTAVALPVQVMSARATQMLFARLGSGAGPRELEPMFATQLVVRASTARAKRSTAPGKRLAPKGATV